MKIKAVGYVRVSTKKIEQSNSIENQKKMITDICKNKNWDLINIYSDVGISGHELHKRKNFIEMLKSCGIEEIKFNAYNKEHTNFIINPNTEPKFNYIIVKNTSRFARTLKSIEVIKLLRKKDVYIYFSDIAKNTKDTSDDFMIQLLQLFATEEIKTKSRRVSSGILQGAKDGVLHVNSNIYGYKLDKINKELHIIENEANVIRIIYKLYNEGYGIRKIIKFLNENNIYTRKNKEFSRNTIKGILQNEKYKGTLVRNKYTKGNIIDGKLSYAKKKPKDEWFVFENKTPIIVDKELFDNVQIKMQNKSNKINCNNRYNLTGKIKCKNCGSKYIHDIDKGRHFWRCKTKKNKSISICNNKNISTKKLYLKINNEWINYINNNYNFNKKQESFNYYEDLKLIIKNEIESETELSPKIIIKKINEIQEKKENLIELKLLNKIEEDDYNNLYNKYVDAIQILNNQLKIKEIKDNKINIAFETLTEIQNKTLQFDIEEALNFDIDFIITNWIKNIYINNKDIEITFINKDFKNLVESNKIVSNYI